MPRPVEALPCGSASNSSTFSPTAASAVPRLIAVVVLPTPPFWLATTNTRSDRSDLTGTAKSLHAHDAASGITQGRYHVCLVLPISCGLGHVRHHILSLEEQPLRTCRQVWPGIPQ